MADYARAYDQLCLSYRAIDDFRAKLLGFLPLVTSGIFLVVDKNPPDQSLWMAIGVFGFVVTIGLFSYELHAIKKCNRLIHTGKHLERNLGINGQFLNRPHEFAGFIDEPFAASVIYPASLGAWTFLATRSLLRDYITWGVVVTVLVFVVGFILSLRLVRAMEDDFVKHCDDKDLDEQPYYCKEPRYRLFGSGGPVDRVTFDPVKLKVAEVISGKAKVNVSASGLDPNASQATVNLVRTDGSLVGELKPITGPVQVAHGVLARAAYKLPNKLPTDGGAGHYKVQVVPVVPNDAGVAITSGCILTVEASPQAAHPQHV